MVVSEVPLSTIERDLLSRGLSFVIGPSTEPKRVQAVEETLSHLETQINKAWSKLRSGPQPHQERKQQPERSLSMKYLNPASVQGNTTFNLNGLHPQIQATLESLKTQVKQRTRGNLTKTHREALRALKARPDIIIKPADKGGTVVVWRKTNYTKEMVRHLSDETTYQKIQQGQTALENARTRSRNLVLKFFNNKQANSTGGILSSAARDYYLAFKAELPNLYLLPKIHKDLHPLTGTWQGRPVLSGCKAPTRPIDLICTALLNPLLSLLDERLKDTTDLLLKLRDLNASRGPVPENTTLFSLDIVSLYPSIPQREAARLVSTYFDDHKHLIRQPLRDAGVWRPPSRALLEEAILHVMRDTILSFNSAAYRQVKGTAIGASSSVAIAEIFVHVAFEHQRALRPDKPDVYFRYIDDIFGIMTGQDTLLQSFYAWTNTAYENLKFTLEQSKTEINFLDTTVFIGSEDRLLHTKAYYKPTNLHTYLRYDSSHPSSLKNSLPYSLGLRLKRINSLEDTLATQLLDLWDMFSARGYPERVIATAKNKLDLKTRSELLIQASTPDPQSRWILPSLYFNGLASPLHNALTDIWNWLRNTYGDHPSWPRFAQTPPMLAWRRGKSLKDHLVHSCLHRTHCL
nr:uncharacterized protein LOC123748778 [Procambarus clarkii]